MKQIFSSAAAIVALVFVSLLDCAQAQQSVISCVWDVGHTKEACEITASGVSTAAENGHVIKATAGTLVGGQLNNWSTTTALTVMLLDATVIPSNGTLATCTGLPSQTNPCILKWYGVAAAPSSTQPATVGISWAPGPMLHFLNGLVAVCSTTGPTTLTLNANCTFSMEIQ